MSEDKKAGCICITASERCDKCLEDSKIKPDKPLKAITPITKLRRIVITSDGLNIDIPTLEVSNLELCEIARRILRKFGGL